MNTLGGLGDLMCLILTEIYLKDLNCTFQTICLSKNDNGFQLTIFVITVVSCEKIKKRSKVRDSEIVRMWMKLMITHKTIESGVKWCVINDRRQTHTPRQKTGGQMRAIMIQ